MARILIDLPETPFFRTEIPLYVQHINHGKHLDNAQLVALVGECRSRFLKHLGYSGGDVEGLAYVVADVAVQYKSEAFYPEVLILEMTPMDFHKYGCDLVFRATESVTGREVARGKQGIIFVDPEARKVAAVPAAFKARFEG